MTTRQAVELGGRFGAKVLDETDDTWTVRVLDRFNLVVHKEDKSVSPHLKNEGFWESWITVWVMHNVGPDMTFIDVGANCGYYTALAESLGAEVIAYEPNPVYAKMLRASKKVNKAKFKVRQFALSDKPGKVTLNVPGDLHGSATIVHDFKGTEYTNRAVSVEATTLNKDLDGVLADKPYVLKIDAESAEEMVWNGAKDILNSDRKGIVMLEWTPEAYSDEFVKDLFAWGDVTLINHSGDEEPVSAEWLATLSDWVMLVIRKQ